MGGISVIEDITAVLLANPMVVPVLIFIAVLPMLLYNLAVFYIWDGTTTAIFITISLLLMVVALSIIIFDPSLFWLVELALLVFSTVVMIYLYQGLSEGCER
jgi:uncharacterized membrane protein